ncbi:hypothetical protein AAFF_G00052830 [Aldrovandia affinis]|uniref:Receptor activity modifying protein 2 n=1 Tax=Aldrovandia affinis TaxID=143900 RepID=A0AAD7T4Y0_9TELE|nr:hypothetical protein AAFF_G00052830 [Aldrovandia affinis]
MTAQLPFLLSSLLLWGGTLQTNITREDDETFQTQDQSHVFALCNKTLLHQFSEYCQFDFKTEMHDTKEDLWCDWEQVIRPYNKLTLCMEYVTSELNCFFPNHIVQEAFLQVHALFFQHCPDQHEGFSDAPQYVMVTLTLVPVCLIPILVSLVVWKSKVRD